VTPSLRSVLAAGLALASALGTAMAQPGAQVEGGVAARVAEVTRSVMLAVGYADPVAGEPVPTLDEALALCQALIDDEQDADAAATGYILRAEVEARLMRSDDALASLDAAGDAAQSLDVVARALSRKGALCTELCRPDEAAEAIERLLADAPEYADASSYAYLTDAYLKLGRDEETVATARDALETRWDEAPDWVRRDLVRAWATGLSWLGRAGEAEEAWNMVDALTGQVGDVSFRYPSWSADGAAIYASLGRQGLSGRRPPAQGLCRVDATTGAVATLAAPPLAMPCVFPSGDAVVALTSGPSRRGGPAVVSRIDAATGEARRLSAEDDDASKYFPVPSPDGATIAFYEDRGDEVALCAMDAATGAKRDVVALPRGLDESATVDACGPPAWSPDGARLAFLRGSGETTARELWTIAADGTDARRLGAVAYASCPAWSPDGSALAVTQWDEGDGEHTRWVWLVDAASGEARPLAPCEWDAGLAWSPDGARIAFAKPDGLYTVEVATGEVRRLTR
jgi:Tol biopolymer transport system component